MAVELQNLTKQFGPKVAVDNLSLSVNDGEVLGLIGQNGAGKTTTFRMLLDFIKPDHGSILFDGQPITPAIRQKIGFLPEERGLYQKWTIEQQMLYFGELHGMKSAAVKTELKHWLSRLEVVGKPTDKVQTLSKGNAQKVQLIATLIFQPKLLILDEPFTGLDPVNTSLMMREIKLLRDTGARIIFSAHNMASVEELSDHLLMLKNGKTVLSGETKAIRESFGRTRVYLEADISDTDLLAIDGVEAITPSNLGRVLKLRDEATGHTVFERVTTPHNYVPAFMQTPPSLDEIFRTEVAATEVEL
ncbi:ABC transporter ATP-binding protein [Periweissella ghanensis]|uniref:Multidrug efflux system ATP-binding protein n=1 Tax=Periweissella ghanensis TaxID=467997 RepID=A0ABN8BN77_9LACO|nr:ABC transporter ATP-binding protein [Periweissella ghanensis]MCM0600461.1 ABC transporter ATP-binding protein [Periweissella ghanensis]CAH0418073.1 Multidrug efflux system ATP-binding protein [Periweissella ghanensis]